MSGRDVMAPGALARGAAVKRTAKRSIGVALLATVLNIDALPAIAFSEAPIAPLISPAAVERADGAKKEDDLPLSPDAIAEARASLRCAQIPFFWCTGGVGQEERAALTAMAEFTLCVEWAERSRPFLAAGTLTVATETGNELMAVDDAGPWWCVALPPGRYRLTASAQPLVEYPPQERLVVIKAKGRRERVRFLW